MFISHEEKKREGRGEIGSYAHKTDDSAYHQTEKFWGEQ